MTPKEKAKELVDKFYLKAGAHEAYATTKESLFRLAQKSAIICVKEIIGEIQDDKRFMLDWEKERLIYWQSVLQEMSLLVEIREAIEKLNPLPSAPDKVEINKVDEKLVDKFNMKWIARYEELRQKVNMMTAISQLVEDVKVDENKNDYWKDKCEGLYRALDGLVKDVRSKPNDTRYNTHLKIAEAVLSNQ